MYTRCPQCARVFTVSAQQLRSAHGDVRCGNCATVFNAVESLTDEAPAAPDSPATRTDPGEAAHNGAGGDKADMTAGAGETENTDAAAGDDAAGDDPLEFDAPEQTWSSFFIEARPPAADGDIALDGDLETVTADPDEWQAMLAEIEEPLPWRSENDDRETGNDTDSADSREPDLIDTAPGDEAATDAADTARPAPEWLGEPSIEPGAVLWLEQDLGSDDRAGGADAGLSPAAVRAAARVDSPAGEAPAQDREGATIAVEDLPAAWAEAAPAQRRRRRAPWLLACLLLAVFAAAQWLHMQRDALAADPRWGEQLRALYAALGQTLYPEWPLAAYTVRRAEAVVGSSAADALDIHAVVEITGQHSVGLPLIGVILRDQWDNPVGQGIFRPEDYLATGLPAIVPPGTRIPVNISVVDPGIQARGYVVDVCLPSRRAGLRCKLDVTPFVR